MSSSLQQACDINDFRDLPVNGTFLSEHPTNSVFDETIPIDKI